MGKQGSTTAERLRCHIVVNGAAGSVQRQRVAEALRIGLPQLEPVVHEPRSVSEVEALLRQIPQHEDIAIAGGDGTLQCLLAVLIDLQRPIVVLPLGTANDFAHQWGFTPDLLSLYHALKNRVIRSVDVIRCNDVYFSTVGGLGVGAYLTRDFNAMRRSVPLMRKAVSIAGSNVYTGLAAATIIGRRAYLREYSIETETEIRSGLFSNVFVCNQSRLGGDLIVAPRARPNDGLFDVLCLRGATPRELLLSLAQLRFNGDPKLSERLQARELKVRAQDGRDNLVFADGEAFEMASELNFSIYPSALKILTAGDCVA